MGRKKRSKNKTPEQLQQEAIQRIHEKAAEKKSRKWLKGAKEVFLGLLGMK
ncbi:hypothetical protein [Draconibacterium mangrovi]|uniref:hypothetical protein n=1 Tax=Draconibacterium mangrovi TaxID=2697469 RepID=UPI0013CFBBF0|nr:hypothetical protein [Draconibacterium mangrovi]